MSHTPRHELAFLETSPAYGGWTQEQLSKNFQHLRFLMEYVLARITSTLPQTTAVGTGAATAETDLQTHTIDSHTFREGSLNIAASGSVTGTANTKTVRLYWGSTVVATISWAAGDTGDWSIECLVTATGVTDQTISGITIDKAGTVTGLSNVDASENSNNPITVKTTGQTTNSADEVTSEVLTVTPA